MSRGRVIVAKVGLDGHTTGAAVVALGLRNAGFDVINLGTHVRPEQVVAAALQEDVDVIGLSILSGAHVHLTRRVCELARGQGVDAAVVVGGTIPESDAAEMRACGAAAVFGPGTSMAAIVEVMERLVAERRGRRGAGAAGQPPVVAGDRRAGELREPAPRRPTADRAAPASGRPNRKEEP